MWIRGGWRTLSQRWLLLLREQGILRMVLRVRRSGVCSLIVQWRVEGRLRRGGRCHRERAFEERIEGEFVHAAAEEK